MYKTSRVFPFPKHNFLNYLLILFDIDLLTKL